MGLTYRNFAAHDMLPYVANGTSFHSLVIYSITLDESGVSMCLFNLD